MEESVTGLEWVLHSRTVSRTVLEIIGFSPPSRTFARHRRLGD